MLKHVVTVGGRDQRPAELLRAAGLQVKSIDDKSFETLAFAANQPDAIVLDLRGASALPAAVSAFRRKHPDTGIVIVTSTLDPGLLVEAMRAGVTEVVPEPLESTALTAAINRVARSSDADDVGHVIGFVGAKGGVGTTTIAVNVATMLGNLSKPGRSLLIDFHGTCGDAAVFTGAEPRFSLADAFDNTHRLDKSFLQSLVTTVAPHTDLLAAPEAPAAGPYDPQKVRRISEIAAVNYKHTVLDVPRSDRVVLDGLDHLRSIYIVINQEVGTVKSATRLVTMLRQRYGSERVAVGTQPFGSQRRDRKRRHRASPRRAHRSYLSQQLSRGAAGAQQRPAPGAREPQRAFRLVQAIRAAIVRRPTARAGRARAGTAGQTDIPTRLTEIIVLTTISPTAPSESMAAPDTRSPEYKPSKGGFTPSC